MTLNPIYQCSNALLLQFTFAKTKITDSIVIKLFIIRQSILQRFSAKKSDLEYIYTGLNKKIFQNTNVNKRFLEKLNSKVWQSLVSWLYLAQLKRQKGYIHL